jgi:hypothetical protein
MKKKWPALLLLACALVMLTCFALWRMKQRTDRVNAALAVLVKSQDDHDAKARAVAALVALGDEAHPQMARAFTGKENAFERGYRALHKKLPSRLKSQLPLPPSKEEIRRALASTLSSFGPTASRAMVGVLEHGFDPLPLYENTDLLCALYWSIPESRKAMLVLSNYLTRRIPGDLLFGMWDAREIWPHVNHLAPLLTNWLQNGEAAGDAIEALGLMGPSAHVAIPALLQIAEIADNPEQGKGRSFVPVVANLKQVSAIEALCMIGVKTPQVLSLLRRNWTNETQRVREATAYGVTKLGPAASPLVDFFVQHLDRKNDRVLQHQMAAIASMGTDASAAVPVLLELSFSIPAAFSFSTKTPRAAPIGYRETLLWNNEAQPGALAAAFALAEIEPAAAARRLELIATGLRTFAPSNAVVRLRPYKSELIMVVEAGLNEGPDIERIVLAHHILMLDGGNRPARELLKAQMAHESLTRRAVAAAWFYRATGDTNSTLPVLSNCLSEMRTEQDQTPLTIVREFGSAAKSLAPQVRPFLEHESWVLRYLAGKALRSIASEAMPPIHEHADW